MTRTDLRFQLESALRFGSNPIFDWLRRIVIETFVLLIAPRPGQNEKNSNNRLTIFFACRQHRLIEVAVFVHPSLSGDLLCRVFETNPGPHELLNAPDQLLRAN